jgi:hypothetical protein
MNAFAPHCGTLLEKKYFLPRQIVLKFFPEFSVIQLYFVSALIFICLSCGTTATHVRQGYPESATFTSIRERPYTADFSHAESDLRTANPAANTVLVNFGPKLLELKASYLEKQEQSVDFNGSLQDGKLRRYLSLLGTSSLGGTGLIGEGELTYTPPDASQSECACDWPRMLRLGLKNRWSGLTYGADYRSADRGFVSLMGIATDHARDEGQVWGEHGLGPFRVRGSIGELWEKLLDTNSFRVTRSATASFNLSRSQWGGMFASSYGLVDQGAGLNQQTTFLTHTIMGSYRPLSFLSLNPNFSIKEEWNQSTGIRTETPRTELMLTYAPVRDSIKLTGGTSFARTFSGDRLSNLRTFGTVAAVDWKLGKFLGTDDILSLNLNYHQQLDSISSSNSHNDVSGMLRFRIIGF